MDGLIAPQPAPAPSVAPLTKPPAQARISPSEQRVGLIFWTSLVLAVVAAGFGAWAARDLLVPIAIAGVVSIMAAPVVAQIERWGAPPLLAAALLVASGMAVVIGLALLAAPDAVHFAQQLPQTFAAIERKLQAMREALAPITAVGERVQQATDIGIAAGPGDEAPWPVVMRNSGSSWLSSAMASIGGVAVQVSFSTVLTVFMLGERRRIRGFLMHAAPNNAVRRRIAAMMLDIRTRVSRFLLTQTMTNFGLAVASALALTAIGFPGALVWGAAVFLGNFIPYAGSFTVQVACLVYGLATLDTVQAALIAPALLWVLNFIEGQFVTPWLVGKHVVISPLAVLLAVGFGGWFWGAAGALVAVPGLIVAASALQHWWTPVRTRPSFFRLKARRRRIYHAQSIPQSQASGTGLASSH